MSTQIVDEEHIRVLVWAGLRPHPDGPLRWRVERSGARPDGELVEHTAARVGTMLHDQNAAAYQERYGDDDDNDDDGLSRSYAHAAPRHTDWSPIDLFKAIEFYVYQSFHEEDRDDPERIEAMQFCGALSRRIGPSLPGWGAASFPAELMETAEWRASPWGIDAVSRPAASR